MRKIAFTDVPLEERPTPPIVWEVISAEVARGRATLYEQQGAYFVKFFDEEEPTPFHDLRYDSRLRLYNTKHFPNLDLS